MHIEIPDSTLRQAEANRRDVLLAVAMQFYSDNRLDLEVASALAGLKPSEFIREVALRGIGVVQYPARRTAG